MILIKAENMENYDGQHSAKRQRTDGDGNSQRVSCFQTMSFYRISFIIIILCDTLLAWVDVIIRSLLFIVTVNPNCNMRWLPFESRTVFV